MRKKVSNLALLPTVLVLLLLGFALSTISAEEFDYERAHQDYSYSLSLYGRKENEYQQLRSEYLQYKTLTAEEKAKEGTLSMLLLRDEVVKTYLTSLRMKIREHKGLTEGEKESYYPRIDDEFKFFEEHKNKLPSAGSLDDLEDDSEEASDKYEESTKIVFFKSLIGIATGKNAYFREEIESQIAKLKEKIAEIRSNGDKDVSSIERSIVDLENKIARSKDKDYQAKDIINTIKTTEKDKEDYYNDALGNTQNAYLYLKEVNNYLLEIIRQIRTN